MGQGKFGSSVIKGRKIRSYTYTFWSSGNIYGQPVVKAVAAGQGACKKICHTG